jgi:hypothetical protein
MSIFHITGFMAGLFVLTSTFPANAGSPRPMGFDLDPEIGSLVHKEKARMAVDTRESGYPQKNMGDDPRDSCGTISINSNNQPQNQPQHLNNRPGKQNVTVVTGPVINAANCR